MSTERDGTAASRRPLFYGWVVVGACATLLTMQGGLSYSFGVFFKPLAATFDWSRAATAGAYSVYMVSHGAFALLMGYLADRFGPARVMVLGGFLAGLALLLTSRINSLWQLYLTFGLLLGIGLSGTFAVGSATTARWFVQRRGLALGVMSTGMGLGTLIFLPVAERLIAAFDWSKSYAIFGLVAWVVMIPAALLLRDPKRGTAQDPARSAGQPAARAEREAGVSLRVAMRRKSLWMLMSVYFLVSFTVQMVMAHLVNYATDLGISPLAAATAVGIIGIGSISGRLVMGGASDRIGGNNALVICIATVTAALTWLIFAKSLWMFYVFAIVFGFAYGGEVPQMAILIGQFFGLRAGATLMGAVMFGTTIGGALGSWLGGKLFDISGSYQVAYAIAAVAGVTGVILSLSLKRLPRPSSQDYSVAGQG